MSDISYELAAKLKEAGFPQTPGNYFVGGEIWDETMQSDYETPSTPHRDTWVKVPTLEELIEELGEKFFELRQVFPDVWHAVGISELLGEGTNPKIALINLYLALKRNPAQ